MARFAIGAATVEEMLSAGIGVTEMAQAKKIASTDLLERRRLTNILFNIAVNHRADRNEPACRLWMAECAGLPNPLIEYEWHLAKGEVAGWVGDQHRRRL